MKKRAMSSEQASKVKLSGHAKEKEFANLIGLPKEYSNNRRAKKDVIDFNGDAHSVKSGKKKWQIFLYAHSRLENDPGFRAMNGMGQLLKACLDVFPNNRKDYESNKNKYKELLKTPMQLLCEKLQTTDRRMAFFSKSFFNAGEVQFLTIFSPIDDTINIFHHDDVIQILAQNLSVENSRSRMKSQVDSQKVVFKRTHTIGEIELRNDSDIHYREIKFWVSAPDTLQLLKENILTKDIPVEINGVPNKRIIRYGKAIKTFKIK